MTRGMRVAGNQRGFTLTELLVATALLALLLGGIVTIQQQGQMAYRMGSNRVETQQNARVALELMVRELRAATIKVAVSPADVTFETYHNDDVAPETVRYHFSDSVLNRTVGGTTTPLIGGVKSFALTYCKVWNAVSNTCTTEAPDIDTVNIIRIQIETRSETTVASGSAAGQSTKLESFVKPRLVSF